MPNRASSLCLLVCLCLGAACAFDVYHLPQQPAQLQPAGDAGLAPSLVMASDLTVSPPGGFQRTIRGGTTWSLVGACAQGAVYKSQDQTLTVEASHVHEAYLTVNQGLLMGFYLPVERSFVALGSPATLPLAK